MTDEIKSTLIFGTNYGTGLIMCDFNFINKELNKNLNQNKVNINAIKDMAIFHWLVIKQEVYSDYYVIDSTGNVIVDFDKIYRITQLDSVEVKLIYSVVHDYITIIESRAEFYGLVIWSLIMKETLAADFEIYFVKHEYRVVRNDQTLLRKKLFNMRTYSMEKVEYRENRQSRFRRNLNIIVNDNQSHEYRIRVQPYNDNLTINKLYHYANSNNRTCIKERIDLGPPLMTHEEYPLSFEELHFYILYRVKRDIQTLENFDQILAGMFKEPIDPSRAFNLKETWSFLNINKDHEIVGFEEYLYELDENESIIKIHEKWFYHFGFMKLMVVYSKSQRHLN